MRVIPFLAAALITLPVAAQDTSSPDPPGWQRYKDCPGGYTEKCPGAFSLSFPGQPERGTTPSFGPKFSPASIMRFNADHQVFMSASMLIAGKYDPDLVSAFMDNLVRGILLSSKCESHSEKNIVGIEHTRREFTLSRCPDGSNIKGRVYITDHMEAYAFMVQNTPPITRQMEHDTLTFLDSFGFED